MLLIGSRAEAYWYFGITTKQDADWDVIASVEEVERFTGSKPNPRLPSWKWEDVEFHNQDFLNNATIHIEYDSGKKINVKWNLHVSVCSSRGLAVLKRSHLHRSLKFESAIRRYQHLDKDFSEKDLAILDQRAIMTRKHFGDRTPNMELTVEEFFDDNIEKPIDHDLIHKKTCYYDEPLYISLQRDYNIVRIEQDLWNALSHEDKVKAVREEAYVIAIERYILPWHDRGRQYPHTMAFNHALRMICTTLCGGFFREFAIDNWQEISNFTQDNFDNFFNSEIWHEYTTGRTTARL